MQGRQKRHFFSSFFNNPFFFQEKMKKFIQENLFIFTDREKYFEAKMDQDLENQN